MNHTNTIDVSRELIEKAMLACFEAGHGITHDELRALLDAPSEPNITSCFVLAKQTVLEIPGWDRKELGYTMLDGVGVFETADAVHKVIAELRLPLGWVSMTVNQLLPGRIAGVLVKRRSESNKS